jgi:hypothetical protein
MKNLLVKGKPRPYYILSFFTCSYAHIADIASFIDHSILYRLANCTAFFVYMLAIGIEAFAKIWAKLDEAPLQVFWRDIPGG